MPSLRSMSRALLHVLIASTLSTAPSLVSAATTQVKRATNNVFTSNKQSNHTDSVVWQLGDVVNVTWTTDFKEPALGFVQDLSNAQYMYFYNAPGPSYDNYTWTVDVNQTAWSTKNTVYYMVIQDMSNSAGTGLYYFLSNPINVVAAGATTTPATATTTSMAAQAPTATVFITAPADTSKTPTVTSSPSSSSSAAVGGGNSGGLSGGATAGIAIAAVAGVAALAGVIFFFLRNRKLRRQLRNSNAVTQPSYTPYDQLPPNMGTPEEFGAAAAAKAGGGAGGPPPMSSYFGDAAKDPRLAGAAAGGAAAPFASVHELPERSASQAHRVSELPADFRYGAAPASGPQQSPVEIGGTELERRDDSSRPLMTDQQRHESGN